MQQDVPPDVGHDRGPVIAGAGLCVHGWRGARRELSGQALPVEVIGMQLCSAVIPAHGQWTEFGAGAATRHVLAAFAYSLNAPGAFRASAASGAGVRADVGATGSAMNGRPYARDMPGDAVLSACSPCRQGDIMMGAGRAGFLIGQRFFNGQTHAV